MAIVEIQLDLKVDGGSTNRSNGELRQNVQYAIRQLYKNSGLTLTILCTLALGIGANTAIFTVDYATLLAPMPHPDPDQLVMVWSKLQGNRNGISAGDYTDWKQQSTAFQALEAWTWSSFNISTKDQPEYVQASRTTPGLNRMMGDPLFLGRYFLPEEGQPGKDHVVLLTYKLWKRLGGDKKIIGTTIQLNNEPHGCGRASPRNGRSRYHRFDCTSRLQA
jgi:putative ABC transport system permease protein